MRRRKERNEESKEDEEDEVIDDGESWNREGEDENARKTNSTRARTQRRQRQRFHHHIDSQRLLAAARHFHAEIHRPRQLVYAAPVVLVLGFAQPRRQVVGRVRETQHVGIGERVGHAATATAAAIAASNE